MTFSYLFVYELKKPDKPNDCPSDWVAATGLTGAGSFCYKMVEGADTDFDGAETYCNGLGEVTGHTTSLISIEDAYEVSFDRFRRLFGLLQGGSPSKFWLHLSIDFSCSKQQKILR